MIWEIDDGAKPIEGVDEHGRPDPDYAAGLGLIPAPLGRRMLATLTELVILLLLALPAVLVVTPLVLRVIEGEADISAMLARGELVGPIVALVISNVLVTAFTIVQLVLHGRRGVTAGKAIFGIRTVNVRTLERPKFWRGAVVRYLLIGVSFLVPVLGPLLVIALSVLFDPERRRRGWLDLAAATWMVDARRGLNPYDVKRMRIARKMMSTPQHAERARLPSLATPVGRDAPAEYVPAGRFSGGVIGAHRAAAPNIPASASPASASPASASPRESSPGQGQAAHAASPAAPRGAFSGMVDAVPPSLAPGRPPNSSSSREPVQPSAPAASAPPVVAQPTPAAADPTDQPAEPAAAVRAVLLLDDGSRIEVRGATLFGRAPAPLAGEGAVQLVPVVDESLSVSKTHLAVLPSRRGVLAVDRGSTNGSGIVRAGEEIALAPGDPIALQAGDTVRFGDRSMHVERA